MGSEGTHAVSANCFDEYLGITERVADAPGEHAVSCGGPPVENLACVAYSRFWTRAQEDDGEAPSYDLTLGHFFLRACEHHGDQSFARSANGESLTYNEVLQRVARIVDACRDMGLEKGDRVVCYSEDTIISTLYTLALSIRGIVFLPLSPQFSVHYLKNLMAQSGALVAFTSMAYAERLVEENIDTVYVSDDAVHHAHDDSLLGGHFDAISIEESLRTIRSHVGKVQPQDVFMIQPTSGSTGQPKLVVRKHVSLLRYAHHVGAQISHPAATRPRFLMIATLTHAFGFHMLATAVSMAAELVIPTRLDVNGSLAEIRALNPTVLPMTPRVLRSLHSQCNQTTDVFFGDGAKFLLVAGGAPHSEHLQLAKAQGVEIITFYGSTEASLLALTPRGAWREGYAGRIAPDVEMKVSANKELLVRSPGQMQEYLYDDTLTRASYTKDGFYKTGDLGEIDADGYVKILGRKHDAYITPEGSYVYPERIEILIESLPWVSQAIVVGDRLPYLSALIVVKEEFLGGEFVASERDAQLSRLREIAGKNLRQINSQLERIEQIARFCLLTRQFEATLYHAAGSGKVCRARHKIAQLQKTEIESIYGDTNVSSRMVVPGIERCDHPCTDLRVHLVLTFKRYATLMAHDLKQRLRRSIDHACVARDVRILAEEVKHDHVHLLLAYPTSRSVSEIVKNVCDESTKHIFCAFPELNDGVTGSCFFDAHYLAVSSGAITDEMIQLHVNQ